MRNDMLVTERKNVFKHGPYPTLVGVVTTMYKGIVNAAPITWFSPISYDPPYLMISIKKENDTAQNIIDNGKFTVQTVPYFIAQEIHDTAESYPRDVSELSIIAEKTQTNYLETVKSNFLSVPHLKIADSWYGCNVKTMYKIGNDHYQFIGEVVEFGISSLPNYYNSLIHCGGLIYGRVMDNEFDVKAY